MQVLDETQYSKLRMCFAPESAAIIGASTDPMKFGGRALKFCLERGYGGRLYPINARNDIVQGVTAYQSVADLPEAPEIAVIAVPAPQVRDNLLAAGKKGCRIAIVYGAQFAEAGGDGRARQDDLLSIAQDHDMRMIGPNCMGVISLASGFVASFTAAPEHHDGNGWPPVGSVSIASQSGAVGIQMFAQLRDRGLGLANWISTGNQADIDVADAIAFYAGDPATRTIAVYMEDGARGLKLIQALELARQAKKPVVVLKVGTTPLGGTAAAGHTASMYVEDRVVDDLFAQYGVLRAASVNELIDLVAACNAGVIPRSNSVAAVSVSGGGAVMISDAAARGGLALDDYPKDALAELKAENAFVNDRNPIDISAPSMSNMAITGGHLKWGTERGQSTMLGYISHVPLVPRTRGAIMPQLLELTKGHPDQLVAIAGNFHPEDRKALVQTGVAVFDDPTVATDAVAKLVATGKAFGNPSQRPSVPERLTDDIGAMLARAGIDLVDSVRIETEADGLAELDRHGDIVLKLAAPDLHHRTELNGVFISLQSPDAVRRAFASLSEAVLHHGGTYRDLHIIAEPMIHGVEFLVGTRADPHFGPLILLGSGGSHCELFDDVVYAKAPVTDDEARRMIAAVRAAAMLDGWRGAPAVDRDALANALVALSIAAAELPSLEINPMIVTPNGATGVDLVSARECSHIE
ncbi:MAG: acetate--CoA ligase family protein [Alphaproteobacteria bacterium]|nr:acetate--CoA ligase family protein [Alphaproteobacteria bacterium]